MAVVDLLNIEIERALWYVNGVPAMGHNGPLREWKEQVLNGLLIEVVPALGRVVEMIGREVRDSLERNGGGMVRLHGGQR